MSINNIELSASSVASSQLPEIAHRLHSISAQLAGFKPTIGGLLEDVDKDVGDTLALLGGMAEYLNSDLSTIADKLERLAQELRG